MRTKAIPAWAAVLLASCIEPAPNAGGRRLRPDIRAAAPYLVSRATPSHPVGAVFGEAIELVGYDLAPEVLVRGENAQLTLTWHALKDLESSYQVFVHLETPDARGRILVDHYPAQGTWPTDAWRPGDLLRDPIRFTVPAGQPDRVVEAWVGWYLEDERLPVTRTGAAKKDGENRLLLARIPLR